MKEKKRYNLKTPEIWPNGNIGAFKRLKWKNKSLLRIRNFALLQWRRMFFLPKAKKKYKNKSTNPRTGSCNSHYAFRSVLDRFTMQEIYNWKLSFISDIQTQLNFEISKGQQNSFTAETALVQRRLASTLSWPHYKFKCSEIHHPAGCLHLVLSRISIATKTLQMHVRSFWRMQSWTLLSHRLHLYLERHVKQMSWHPNF